jgi:HK97 family phage prohead protease
MKKGENAGVSRVAVLERAADGSIAFDASSFPPDRYGDTIVQAGFKTDNFKANPVLLWAHSHSCPPVGKVGTIGIGPNGNLRASDVTFTPPEMHEFGDEVGQMVRAGFLNAVSVGFLPLKWEARFDESGEFLGYNFLECELLEISIVPVPANPQALIDGRGFTKSIAAWATKPDDSSPMANRYQAQVQTFLKSAEEMQTRATDEADGAGFEKMIGLLERLVKSSEENGVHLRAIRGGLDSIDAEKAAELELPDDLALLLLSAPSGADPAPIVPAASVGEDAGEDSIASVLSAAANNR